MSIDILKEDIKNGKIRNTYLFYGEEEYLKKYYLDSLEKDILKNDLTGLNKIVFENKPEIGKLIDAIDTLPAFSEKKLVIVKNSGLMKSKKNAAGDEKKGTGHNEDLLKYVQNMPEFTVLVFCEQEIDKRIKLVDAVKKNGLIVEFPFQKPLELVKWVIKVFKSSKKEIDSQTASYLVENCEQGMNEILNEINKLILYLGNRNSISKSDIDKVSTKSIKSRVFDLTDAIFESNISKALKILDDIIILKEPVPKILFMITRQLRQILEMKLMLEKGMSSSEAAAKLGIMPFLAGKVQKQASKISIAKLKSALEESLEFDLSIKTGKINDRIAAELLISRFQ